MKRILVMLVIASSMHYSFAQKSTNHELPNRLFNEGKDMFNDNNYVGSQHSLEEFKKVSTDKYLITEADYMIVSSQFLQGKEDAGDMLKEYLDTHPETSHRDQLCFYIGSSHFAEQNWKKAIYWLNQADVSYLSPSEQEDYSFRLAFANLQEGNKAEATRLFGLLTLNSERYLETSKYYLAYLDFQNGKYEKALPVFEKLKNNASYKEQALFFITQGSFLKGDLNTAISEGENYILLYPNSKNTAEVHRILGNSYNRMHNTSRSIANYEKYLLLDENPFREDMYLLGTSYFETGAYAKAAETFKRSANNSDKLGQASYMQLGQAYLKLNDNTNALLAFDAASRTNHSNSISESALYNYGLLVHQTSLSPFDESITVFQRFLQEYPKSKYTNEVNSILATTLLSTKNYQAALSTINSIQSPAREILAAKQMILFQLGTQDFINGKYDSANDNFNTVINMGNYDVKAKNDAYFWRAEISYRRGSFDSAIKDYQMFLTLASSTDSNYSLALYNLGYAFFKTKQYSAAGTAFKRYIDAEKDRSKPIYVDALNRLGDCALFNRNFGDAERYYSLASQTNPANAAYAEYQKAFVLGLQKNYAGKVKTLDEMMAKYPNSEYYDDALFEKSRSLVMMDKESEAILALEKLIKEHPESQVAKKAGVQLGQLYFNTNDSQKSIRAYKQVIENHPNSDEARIAIQSLESVYKDNNDISSYANYVNSLGGTTIISASRQDSLTYLAAESAYMKGQKASAKNGMTNYLESYPRGAFASAAHFHLGVVAFENKDMNTALAEFNKVISSKNEKYINDALIYVSGIQFEKKNFQDAYNNYKQLETVASSNENRQLAQLGMLRCAFLTQKDKEVIQVANKLIDDSKTSPEIIAEARYYRGKAFLNLNQTENAMKDLQVLSKDTRSAFGAEAQYLLIEGYYKAKAYDKAEKQVFEFIKLGTPHEYWMARSFIVLSDSYAARGDKFQAKQYLESLKANYKGTESDIKTMITERLSALNN